MVDMLYGTQYQEITALQFNRVIAGRKVNYWA